MNKKTAIAWLYRELPALERADILSHDTVEKLKAYYGPVTVRSRRIVALMLLSILGASSIGLGILLLLAHNWEELPRSARTVLSFVPLLAGQALAGWTLLRRSDSLAWREGSGMFLALAVGASISLISQTYHIGGDVSAFLLTWLVLGGPLIYFLNSSAVALLYIAGLTGWAGAIQFEGGHALLFWPLAAFLAPHLWHAYKDDPEGPRVHVLAWGICAALPIAAGLVLERSMPGLWIVVYSALFCLLLLGSRTLFGDFPLNAFRVSGFVGCVVLTLILTYKDVWNDIGWEHYRAGGGYHAWAAWQDYLLAMALLTGVVVLVMRGVERKDGFAAVSGGLPLLATIGFTASALNVPASAMMAAFNVYMLLFGAVVLLTGLKRNELLTVNAGMAVFSLLIIARFFDAGISFTLRGILFILLGLAFLGANLALARRTAAYKETSA